MTTDEIEAWVWPPNVIPCWFEPRIWDAIYACYRTGESIEALATRLNTHPSFVAVIIRRKKAKIFGKPRR